MDEYMAELLQSLADATKLVREEKNAREAKRRSPMMLIMCGRLQEMLFAPHDHESVVRLEVIDQPDPGSPTYIIADKNGTNSSIWHGLLPTTRPTAGS